MAEVAIDIETIKWLLVAVIIPAVIGVFVWLTRQYLPARQKHADDTANSIRTFSEQSQGSALGQVLETQKQLIDHLIASNNGHLSALTDEVHAGFNAAEEATRDVVASINKLLELMSRQQANYNSMRNEGDPMAATIKTASGKKADAVVADAVATDETGGHNE